MTATTTSPTKRMPAAFIGNGSPMFHVELGARLAPLRDRDVLVLGSGNVGPQFPRDRLVQEGDRLRLGAPVRRGRALDANV